MKSKLIEQEFDLKKIKYSAENQIKKPILSQWYYDIPMVSDIPEKSSFGLVKVNIQVVEYEGSKSRYVYKLPNFWNDNKNLIIKDVTPIIEKALK